MAVLIFRFLSYSSRSFPSRLFLYRYSRRNRAFRLIMLSMYIAYFTLKRVQDS